MYRPCLSWVQVPTSLCRPATFGLSEEISSGQRDEYQYCYAKPRRLGPLGMLFNQIGFRTPLQRVPPEKCPAPLQYRCQGCFYVGHPTLATPLPPSNRLLTCQRRRAVPAEPTLNGVLDRGPIRHRGFRFCSFCLRAKTLDQEQIGFVVITTHPVHWFYSKRTMFETGTWSYTEYYGMSSGAICKTSTGFNV